jgi:hypothetical protein
MAIDGLTDLQEETGLPLRVTAASRCSLAESLVTSGASQLGTCAFALGSLLPWA